MAQDELPRDPMARLLAIMARLRDPATGCPWDVAQSYATIAPYTIEEAYEVADAVEREDWDDLRGELGDLLLQVVYFAQMAEEDGRFGFDEIAGAIGDKMIARHPHVFGTDSPDRSAGEQALAWEAQKQQERAAAGRRGTLDGVALNLPALSRALKLQRRAARVGFDWPDTRGVLDKIIEEAGELAEAADAAAPERVADELGDLLFTIVNLARHLEVDPETALRRANARFERRFGAIERRLSAEARDVGATDPAELDRLWEAAKDEESVSD
jgi:ATP diphosphatase